MAVGSEGGDLDEGCGQVEARIMYWANSQTWNTEWQSGNRSPGKGAGKSLLALPGEPQTQNEMFSMQSSYSESFYYKEEANMLLSDIEKAIYFPCQIRNS